MEDIHDAAELIERYLRDYSRGLLTQVQVGAGFIYALTFSGTPELDLMSLANPLPPEVVAALYEELKYLVTHDYEKIWALGPNPLKEWRDPLHEERQSRCRRACSVLIRFLSSHNYPASTQ